MQEGIPSLDGVSEHHEGSDDNSSSLSLSEFSVTPNSSTNSTNDEGEMEGIQAADPIQECKATSGTNTEGDAPMPFPPTPDNSDVGDGTESAPLIKLFSYQDIKDSIYFQDRMARSKKTKKLTANQKAALMAGKQQHTPIQSKPLRKTGTSKQGVKNEVDNAVKAGRKQTRKGPAEDQLNGRSEEAKALPPGYRGPAGNSSLSEVY